MDDSIHVITQDLVQCYQQYQTDIILNMKNVSNNIIQLQNTLLNSVHQCNKSHSNVVENFNIEIAKLNEVINARDKQITDLKLRNNELADQIHVLSELLKAKNECIAELQMRQKTVEDENESFRKVSRIIAYANENARLNRELDAMKRKLDSIIVKPDTMIVEHHQCDDSIENHVKSLEMLDTLHANMEVTKCATPAIDNVCQKTTDCTVQVDDEVDEADIDVFEKTIKGVVYYVSNDDNKRVFERLDDGSIGKEIGKLQLVNKRTKIVYIE